MFNVPLTGPHTPWHFENITLIEFKNTFPVFTENKYFVNTGIMFLILSEDYRKKKTKKKHHGR